ncbi:ABC transporter ATP-binding protein [Corynebacterium liangguodongii]|uniref:Trehalose import ATP-binding protein SugC n=1 Tax=Corynebacterium liangguodongii TaxID=2079535 RepID=A0A2S0WCJ3_9CORY|nr:sn-glycerol-3-phosphate ABC transporter ATP-binding protein UgpC [Corynebacterium liangguodongii]AWB83476.1 sugar ABC transporter ATP-binding protein [Corynebacterium liangguodongii]PWC00435.1 sn-glycerol-3-phosphate ABC transporter ATP-binding protein UgpC [Corynebacterium liangguodongii]
MSEILFDAATLQYPGNPRPTINNLDLKVNDGELIAVVGPSGSGKSTTLRMVAGLEALTSGEIYIGGTPASSLPPSKRDVAMVFQSYALYPHMTVADNMAFALKMQKVPKEERDARVKEASRLLELDQYLDRLPKALSGGQRQRVAMGRAIVRKPKVFLMDEPLSNLDAKLRVSTRTQISQLQRDLGTTMLYVTHDQVEAMTMADRIAVLEGGNMQQVGSPEELYLHPANVFVATFIGSPSMNLLNATIDNNSFLVGSQRLAMPALEKQPSSSSVIVGIRPEDVELASQADADILGEVRFVENFGSDKFVHVFVDSFGTDKTFLARIPNTERFDVGSPIALRVNYDKLHVFDGQTEERLVR